MTDAPPPAMPPELPPKALLCEPMVRQYLMVVRDVRLQEVEAIERLLNITPRTSELRKEGKQWRNSA